MIKVECVSCKSPYDVDERRVPEKGMKMRCPSCGTSFLVARDGSATTAAAPASIGVPPPAATFKQTLVGQKLPAPPPPIPPPPVAGPALGKGTMVGMTPPLPAPAPAVAPVVADLPALKTGPKAAMPWGALSSATPAVPAGSAKATIAASAFGAPAPAAPAADEIDLPAPKASMAGGSDFGMVDLPAPKTQATGGTDFGLVDLPAPKHEIDLPAPKHEIDLPAPKHEIDLPAPKAVASGGAQFGDLDLPAPKLIADLPAPRGVADLPMPRGQADLPVSKARHDESSFGDIELPDLPIEPSVAPRAGGFGDIELPPPRPAADLIPPKARTVQGHGAKPPVVSDESSFGGLNIDSMPPSLMGDDEVSFSDVKPEDDELRFPVSNSIPAALGGGSIPPALGGADEGNYDLGDDDEAEPLGEADLPGEATGSEEDMEFGIAEGEDEGFQLPPEMLRRQRGDGAEAATVAKGRRAMHLLIGVAVALAILGGGGAALGLTDYGFFGVYYLERYLPEAGDPGFVRDAISRAEKTASSDTYRDVRRSLALLGDARRKFGLNRELLARSMLHEAYFLLRFGGDPVSAGHVAALSQRLEERHGIAPGMALARAADAARKRNWQEASALLSTARGEAPNDGYVDLVAGEVALRQGKLAEAEKAFALALKHRGGARAQWGLARVVLGKTDEPAQLSAVEETLKLSPLHVEARVAKARLLFAQGKEDRAMDVLRQALGQDPVDDQYLWTSKLALSQGYSLLGYVHEARGRLHLARKGYEDALRADPYLVDALLGAGRVMVREKRFNDALPRFESAMNIAQKSANPIVLSGRRADVEASLGEGRVLLALQKAADARAKLTALMEKNPNDAEIILAVGQAEEALGNRDAAERLYRQSIDLAPTVFAGYLALSQYFFKRNQVDKASETLNLAASKVEENSEMRRMLGQSELARGRLESAIHEFKRASELDPQDLDARFGLAIAYRKNGQLELARQLFDDVGARDPHYATLTLERGQLFEAQGDYGKAVDNYRTALAKDPDDTSLLLRLGAAQVEAGSLEDAEQTLQRVIRDTPNSAEAEYFIGRIAFARGRGPDALTHFDRALALDGTQAVFHLYAARAALEMSNIGRVVEEIAKTLDRDATLGDAYWVRGVVRTRTGAVQDALKDLQRAIELKPGRIEAYAALAECYDELRRLPQSIATYRLALQKDPARAEWWYKLGRVHLDLGERGPGAQAMAKAIELTEKIEPPPYWLHDAYRLAAEVARAENNKKAAINLYKRYLDVAPHAAIDRAEIRKILRDWGVELDDSL